MGPASYCRIFLQRERSRHRRLPDYTGIAPAEGAISGTFHLAACQPGVAMSAAFAVGLGELAAMLGRGCWPTMAENARPTTSAKYGCTVSSRRSRVVRFRVWNTSSLVILTAHHINTAVFCTRSKHYSPGGAGQIAVYKIRLHLCDRSAVRVSAVTM